MARSHEDFVDIVKIKNPSVEIVGIYTKAQDRIAVKCKECGSLMVEKGKKLVCTNEECGYVTDKINE